MKLSNLLKTTFALSALLLGTVHSNAQATRTWVSGVGDDANPGSRTAPCKTFAGSISKTAAGGEINVIDPGGFGAVSITKSMTIDGYGSLASILATGTNGVIINAGATDVVILRNIEFKNAGGGVSSPSGLFAVKVLQAGTVYIENCTFDTGTDRAVSFTPSNAGAKLFVRNSTFVNFSGGGIFVAPTASATATITNCSTQLCRFGLRAEGSAKVTAKDCVFTTSTGTGVVAFGAAEITLDRCEVSHSVSSGINSGVGAGSSIVRLSNSTIINNLGQGLLSASAQIISYGNNVITGNTPDGAPTSTVLLK